MKLAEIAEKLIPQAENKIVLKNGSGETRDIVKEVLQCFAESKEQLKKFAPALQGATALETCSNIWNFWKSNIRYQVDPQGKQWIKTPAAVWATKFCDCKSFSVAVATTCYALGIDGKFRFSSYGSNSTLPTHVYFVAMPQGKEIIIDCVWTAFNSQKPYNKIWDYNMTSIYRISGFNAQGYAVGELNIDVNDNGTTQAELDLAINKRRLELEQKIHRRKQGIGSVTDTAYQVEIEAHNAALGQALATRGKKLCLQAGPFVGSINRHAASIGKVKKRKGGLFKKIGQGLKKVVSAIPRLIIKNQLPKSAPFFLYTFITDPRVLAKLPTQVGIKKAKAEKYKKILVQKLGLKEDKFNSIVRSGIMENLGDTPENVIAKWMKEQNYQIGILPIIAAGGKFLVTIGKKLLGKAAENLKSDVENYSPASEDWGNGVDAKTAEAQASSGGSAVTPTGGGDYNYNNGDGDAGNTKYLNEDGSPMEGKPGDELQPLPGEPAPQQAGGGGMMLVLSGIALAVVMGKKGKK